MNKKYYYRIIMAICLFISMFCCIEYANAEEFALPLHVHARLQKDYKGWKYPKIEKKVLEFFKENKNYHKYPNYIKGDFNGDGKEDYAVQIVSSKEGKKRQVAIVYLQKKNTLEEHVLEINAVSGYIYLWLFKKGEKDYDYGSNKKFVYKYDSAGVMSYGESGRSHVYENGKFTVLWTSD